MMGAMKFSFANPYGIYLHDTPLKPLFAKDKRTLSLGCIRLEDAPRLGRWLLNGPIPAVSDAPEQHVQLPAGVPIYVTYLTARADGGQLELCPGRLRPGWNAGGGQGRRPPTRLQDFQRSRKRSIAATASARRATARGRRREPGPDGCRCLRQPSARRSPRPEGRCARRAGPTPAWSQRAKQRPHVERLGGRIELERLGNGRGHSRGGSCHPARGTAGVPSATNRPARNFPEGHCRDLATWAAASSQVGESEGRPT